MSHLAEVYAKDLGVRIGKPVFKTHFFPITHTNYITLHTDNSVQSKQYDYWEEVITMIKKAAPKLKILQIGSGKEPRVQNIDDFIKTNSIKQSAYIIQNGLLHMGIDSSPVHIASLLNKPIVAIYAHTYARTCDPLWGDKENITLIESHRDGDKPSFSTKESDKKINKIEPEEIANSVLNQLGFKGVNIKTLFMGNLYKKKVIDVVPDHPYDLKEGGLCIRLDIEHNEDNAKGLIENNVCAIICGKPIDESLLCNKNIQRIAYISKSFNEDFVNKLIKYGKKFDLLCTDEENISDERVKYFDQSIATYNTSKIIEENKKIIELEDFSYSSYKKVIKNKKSYASHYAANNNEDLDDFYLDLQNMFVYHLAHEQE
jgi:hypothetical protein